MEGTMTVEDVDQLVESFLALELVDGLPDGLDAQALEAIIAIPRAPGESYTDQECLQLIHRVVNHWAQLVDL